MKTFKRLLTVLLTVAILASTLAVGASAIELKTGIGVVETNGLRLRAKPNTDAEILANASYGDNVVIIRQVDGWYLVIPDHWQKRMVVYRNDNVNGQRTVVFALWQGEDKDPTPFLSIYRLTGASSAMRATTGNRFVLAEDGSAIYAAAFHTGWDCGLDQTELLENFRLIVSSWSGE